MRQLEWLLARDKRNLTVRDLLSHTLFTDARKLGRLVDPDSPRAHRRGVDHIIRTYPA